MQKLLGATRSTCGRRGWARSARSCLPHACQDHSSRHKRGARRPLARQSAMRRWLEPIRSTFGRRAWAKSVKNSSPRAWPGNGAFAGRFNSGVTLLRDSHVDPRIARLKTPQECERFAKNADALNKPELAKSAKKRAIELKALEHGAKSDAEREALEAIYAVEEMATQRNGRRTKAARTWQSIRRYGILETVERVVSRPKATDAYNDLVELGLDEFTFEAVVIKYQSLNPQSSRVSTASYP
jgi:hypothetical protein